MLTTNQMKSIVYYVRTKEYGDCVGRITSHPLCNVGFDDERHFFQFMLSIPVLLKSGNNPNEHEI